MVNDLSDEKKDKAVAQGFLQIGSIKFEMTLWEKNILKFHDGISFQCNICECRLSTKVSLADHIKALHGEKKYACSQCEFETWSNHKLNYHKLTFHERIRYPCNQCEHEGSTKSNLTRHKKVIHGKKY